MSLSASSAHLLNASWNGDSTSSLVPDNPLSEEAFPNIQSKPPLFQLQIISSFPIPCYLEEETNTHTHAINGLKDSIIQWQTLKTGQGWFKPK